MSPSPRETLARSAECRLCGGSTDLLYADLPDRLFNVSGRWDLRRCPRCELVAIDPPIMDPASLYPAYYTHTPDPPPTGLRRAVKDAILAAEFGYRALDGWPLLGQVLARLGPLRDMAGLSVMMLDGRRPGRLLDVGCGNGQFLAIMRTLGWDVCGVDVDEKALAVARHRFGVPVHHGMVEQVGLPGAAFDAVTLHHVIEHVPDPVRTLRECGRVLRPGGRIVVVTPNIDSLGHRLFRARWLGLDVPRHLSVFSVRSLRRAAEAAGLSVESVSTTARHAHLVYAASFHLARNGVLPGARVQRVGPLLGLTAVGFQALEHLLSRISDRGEEIIMVVTRGSHDAGPTG